MIRKSVLAVLSASLLLAACQTDNWGGGETLGTAGGAAAGGLLGSQFGKGSGNAALTLTGVLLGGFVGNRLGATVDEGDKAAATKAEQRAYTAPVGQQITWNNPQNGNTGTITPTRDGYAQNGAYCREFQQTITVGGQQQQGYGRACQQPDGSWKIVQ
ncbi:MAG TPA: RT0821/Lpp0805 family surface protein [Alphaproteobacteria bacterium]|nr:RT0821/Lpp0805 family surface protein [Alphaproteobacteria bacterium]